MKKIKYIEQLVAQTVLFFLSIYKWVGSPFFSALGVECRFTPSCSQYMREAVQVHGPVKGVLLGLWRLLHCHPAGGCGHDPVPGRRLEEKNG